ncbi:MAG TPA: DoxX family protein [Chitinophagaceae bacterium]|nr:DoxX family protein [Chitinophagaceae bacterium]
MKKLLQVNNAAGTTDVALLLARVGIALLMLTHGFPKLMLLFSDAPNQFPSVMGMGAEVSLALTVFAEVLCSVFVLTGFATRFAVIPLAITMLVAVFLIHGADPFSAKEPALHYLLVYVILLVVGSGKYSVDHLLQQKKVPVRSVRNTEDPTVLIYQ